MIDQFRGEYAFLSNMFEHVELVKNLGVKSLEHLYQAAKTRDKEAFKKIAMAPSPYQAKKMGNLVTLPEDWVMIRVPLMASLLDKKFDIPFFRDKLLATGNKLLVEGNWWHDCFWGDCKFDRNWQLIICPRCKGKERLNNLGKLLMEKRRQLNGNN